MVINCFIQGKYSGISLAIAEENAKKSSLFPYGLVPIHYFCSMSSIRQNRIENVIQEEVSKVFQQNARALCLGAMVTATVVRVTPDLGMARVYLSIFAGPPKDEVLQNIQANKSKIRGDVGRRLKSMKHIPDLEFRIDDSLDYAEKIDELLKE